MGKHEQQIELWDLAWATREAAMQPRARAALHPGRKKKSPCQRRASRGDTVLARSRCLERCWCLDSWGLFGFLWSTA